MKELPEDWTIKPLAEIAEVNPTLGVTIPKEVSFVPMSSVSEITGIADPSQVRKSSEVVKGYTPFQEQDLIFAKITPCMENGKMAIASGLRNGVGFGSTEFHVLRFKNEALPQFYFYFLRQEKIRKFAESHMTGSAGQRRVPASFIKQLMVPVPPLDTQRKIVAILDKVEETKRLRAQANELTQKLLQSVFLEMFGDLRKNPFGWISKTLNELTSEVVDCPHSTPSYIDEDKTYPCIRTTELKDGFIDWSKMKYVDEAQYRQRTKRLIPQGGDIVYGREGTFGVAARIPSNTKICLGQRVMLFRPNYRLCTSEFLWALLNSPLVYNQALNKTCGSTVGHVNVKDIMNFTGVLPSLPLQKRYSEIVSRIESMRDYQSTSSDSTNVLCGNIFSRAFSGEPVA